MARDMREGRSEPPSFGFKLVTHMRLSPVEERITARKSFQAWLGSPTPRSWHLQLGVVKGKTWCRARDLNPPRGRSPRPPSAYSRWAHAWLTWTNPLVQVLQRAIPRSRACHRHLQRKPTSRVRSCGRGRHASVTYCFAATLENCLD